MNLYYLESVAECWHSIVELSMSLLQSLSVLGIDLEVIEDSAFETCQIFELVSVSNDPEIFESIFRFV